MGLSIDKEKVIKGLQIERECVSRNCDRDCGKCDLVQDRDWLLSVYDDALALLKEQEPVKPKYTPKSLYSWECGVCTEPFDRIANYCPKCGKAVKWE